MAETCGGMPFRGRKRRPTGGRTRVVEGRHSTSTKPSSITSAGGAKPVVSISTTRRRIGDQGSDIEALGDGGGEAGEFGAEASQAERRFQGQHSADEAEGEEHQKLHGAPCRFMEITVGRRCVRNGREVDDAPRKGRRPAGARAPAGGERRGPDPR